MNRGALIKAFEDFEGDWDVVIVGGGATGLGILLDASQRGLKAVLFERGDFAQETSSFSTKLVHSGIRYLKDFKLSHYLESLSEQIVFRKSLPNLVSEIDFLIPTQSLLSFLWFRAGLLFSDALTYFKKFNSPFPFCLSKGISKRNLDKYFPNLKIGSQSRGILYQDCQFDDSRCALNIANKALEFSGIPLNYFEAIEFLKSDSKISGVICRDRESGKIFHVQAKIVVNATGPESDSLRKLDDQVVNLTIQPVQGTHVVLPMEFLGGKTALMIPETKRGRVFYAIPWMNRTLIGTTETLPSVSINGKLVARASKEEIEYLLEEFNSIFEKKALPQDILSVFSGIRPLIKVEGVGSDTYLPRDHAILVSATGLISVIGGKWTTYRKMAEDVVDCVFKNLKLEKRESKTKFLNINEVPNINLDREDLKVYGKYAADIVQLEHDKPELKEKLDPALPYRWSMVYWAIHHEMAIHLSDVLIRRTRTVFLDAKLAAIIAPKVANFIARELGKDSDWIESEVEEFLEQAKDFMAASR